MQAALCRAVPETAKDQHREEAVKTAPTSSTASPADAHDAPKISDYLFFCSEHPDCEGYILSNWYNMAYEETGHYEHQCQKYWCSELALMEKKLAYCRNADLAAEKATALRAMLPRPLEDGETWEATWKYNHDQANKLKQQCRDRALDLDVELWNQEKYSVMVDILRAKFCPERQPRLAAMLIATQARQLVEAAHYDPDFGVGLQAGTHRPRNKPELTEKSILGLRDGQEIWLVPPGPRWGKNLLGRALMEIRGELMRHSAKCQQ